MSNMKKQYEQIKKQYPNHLLCFRLGDFWESYYEDAEIIAKELDLVLTGRNDGETRIPMVGFPVAAEKTYAARLVSNGYKVAFCTYEKHFEITAKTREEAKRKAERLADDDSIMCNDEYYSERSIRITDCKLNEATGEVKIAIKTYPSSPKGGKNNG